MKDRLSGKVIHGARSGPVPYLTSEEESELVQFLLTSAKIGYPKTKDEVVGIVRKVVQKKRGIESAEEVKGRGWMNRFMERWPSISLWKGDALATPRAQAITAANIDQYYTLLKSMLEEYCLMGCPSRIYNMDETGMPLDHKPPKVGS